jgi:hypothetical protein
MKVLPLSIVLLIWASPSVLFAQVNHTDDSVIYHGAVESALSKSLTYQKAINIGSEYSESIYDFRDGHQFFLSDEKFTGDILYNGIQYTNTDLQYDIVQDIVVTEHVSGRKIFLVSERITEFTLGGHVFRRFPANKDDKVAPGFYDVLVESEVVKLLAKREKRIRGQTSNLYHKKEKSEVEEKTKYFLVNDGIFFPVKSYKDIVELLFDKRKGSGVDVKKQKSEEARMINTVMYYAHLKNEP